MDESSLPDCSFQLVANATYIVAESVPVISKEIKDRRRSIIATKSLTFTSLVWQIEDSKVK